MFSYSSTFCPLRFTFYQSFFRSALGYSYISVREDLFFSVFQEINGTRPFLFAFLFLLIIEESLEKFKEAIDYLPPLLGNT
ncbi:MAG: hypothetical protein ACI97P_002024 [Arcticibacterium sp.]